MSTKNYAARVTIGGELKATFKQAFGGASGAVNKLKSEIQGLSRQRKDLEAFQKASANVDKFKSSLVDAKAKLAEARKAFADAEKPTAKLTRALDTAERKVNGLEASIQKENEALTVLSKKLKAAGMDTANLAKADARLKKQMDRRSAIVARQKNAQSNFTDARGRFGSNAASLGIFAAGSVAAFAPMIKAAADFETKIEGIKKTGGFSDADGRSLKSEIERLASPKETNRSESQLLGSAEQMAADGAGLDQIKNSLREIGRASVATSTGMEDLTKTSLAFQNNMGIAAKDSKAAFGIIATGAKAGSFEIQDMAKALPAVLAQGSAIGLKGKEGLASTVAALEIAKKGAGTNDEAANNVRNLLAKINAPETVKRFKEKFGVDWKKESTAAAAKGLDPLIFALDKIQEVTKGDSFKRGELFGDMQVNAALTPLLKFQKEFDQIRKDALAGEGLIDIDFIKSMKTTPEVVNSLKNSVGQLGRMAGDELLPVVKDLAISVAKTLNKIIDWRKENPKLFSNLVKGAAAITLITAGVLALGVAAAGIAFAWSGLSLVFAGLGTVIGALSLPVVAVVAAIGAAALAVRKYWEPISAFFQGVWKGITDGWNAAGGPQLWEEIKSAFGQAKTALFDFLEPVKLTPEEFKKFFESGEKVGKFIGETLVFLIRGGIDTVKTFADTFRGLWTAVEWTFNKIKEFLGPVLEQISGMISPVIDKLKGITGAFSGAMKAPTQGYQGQNYMVPGGASLPSLPAKDKSESRQINNIQIHTQPGQSEEAIVQTLIRKLRDAQQQDARGSFFDGSDLALT